MSLRDIELPQDYTEEHPVSSACAASMHACCFDWDLCGCPVCHKTCGQCGLKCRAIYVLMQAGIEVCASCYKKMRPPPGRTTACEGCSNPSAYRHPGTHDDRYLCPSCHVEAGHLRTQDHGE